MRRAGAVLSIAVVGLLALLALYVQTHPKGIPHDAGSQAATAVIFASIASPAFLIGLRHRRRPPS